MSIQACVMPCARLFQLNINVIANTDEQQEQRHTHTLPEKLSHLNSIRFAGNWSNERIIESMEVVTEIDQESLTLLSH